MFLGLMLLVLVIMRIRHGREASRWVRWPIAITAAGMAVSAVVIPRVETAQFRAAGGVNPLGATLSRLWSQILPVHERLAPLGLAGLAAGSVGIVIATLSVLRRRDPTFWWSLPLTYTALVAPVVFAAVSVTWVDYFDRYAYFAAPAIVLGVGLVVQSLKSSAWRRAVGIVLLLTAVPAAVTALTTAHRPDYEKASEVSNRLIDEGNLVLYEQDSSIAAFRPAGFPGVPLYVPASSPVISTEFVARDHLEIEPGKRPLILVLGLTEGIPGWIEVEVSDQFQMLIPEHEPQEWSFVEQARSLWLACEGFPPENGSYLCVSAVRAFFEAGDIQAAKSHAEVTLQRLEGSSVRSKIEDFLKGISPDLVD